VDKNDGCPVTRRVSFAVINVSVPRGMRSLRSQSTAEGTLAAVEDVLTHVRCYHWATPYVRVVMRLQEMLCSISFRRAGNPFPPLSTGQIEEMVQIEIPVQLAVIQCSQQTGQIAGLSGQAVVAPT
jgi:hypothetical protein